jgi:NADPH:quinone reductase-like Zn-dependent oxidoreductase
MQVTQGWRWHSSGSPKQLFLETLELPALGDREVLIENHMIAFNPVDWKLIAQKKGNPWKAGHIPGVDGMGTISAIGNSLRHFRIGARVAYHTNLKSNGSFARHTIVPGRAVMAVPAAVSDAAAASLPCPGLTAWQALAKLPNMSGETLLVTAAAGSVGRYVTQLALQRNIRVFACASREDHAWLQRLGVQAAADYHDRKWVNQLRKANGGEPFHAIIDLVSSKQATELIAHLGYYGHIVSVVNRIQRNPQPAFGYCVSLHEIALGAQHEVGSEKQWQQLVRAGEAMLDQMASGMLALPPMKIGEFADLPSLLDEFKTKGRGVKYLIQLS